MKTLSAIAALLMTSSIGATAQAQTNFTPVFVVDFGQCDRAGGLDPIITSGNGVVFGKGDTCHAGRVVSTKRYKNITKITGTADLSKITQYYVNAAFYLVETPGKQPKGRDDYCDSGGNNPRLNCREIDFLETNGNVIMQATLHLGPYRGANCPGNGCPAQRWEMAFAATAQNNACFDYAAMQSSIQPGNGLHSVVGQTGMNNTIDLTQPFVVVTTFDLSIPSMKTVYTQSTNTALVYDSTVGNGAQGSDQIPIQDLKSTMNDQGYWILASFWQGFSPTGPDNKWVKSCSWGALCTNSSDPNTFNKYWALSNVQVTAEAELGPSQPSSMHDFDGNMISDIVWRDISGDLAVWLMNGTGVASSAGLGNVPTTWSIVGQRDFDGDGKTDLLWRDTSGNTAIWFMNGVAVVSSAGVGNIPISWTVVATGDFNGDGMGDILWRDSSGNLAVWLMNGATVLASGSIGNLSATWSLAGIGDFDGDGTTDLLWRDNLGNTSIWFMNGTTVASTAGVGNIATTWTVVGTGDFNGDHRSDVVWRDGSGNTSIWLMNGAAVSSAGSLGTIPTTSSIAQTGDFDGDGKSDLLWRDTSGNTSVWFMNGTAVASTASLGNVPTAWTVQSVNAE